jgi:hypothetical protein
VAAKSKENRAGGLGGRHAHRDRHARAPRLAAQPVDHRRARRIRERAERGAQARAFSPVASRWKNHQ